jgi:hypothetical protein
MQSIIFKALQRNEITTVYGFTKDISRSDHMSAAIAPKPNRANVLRIVIDPQRKCHIGPANERRVLTRTVRI